jgi:hypothetical protein
MNSSDAPRAEADGDVRAEPIRAAIASGGELTGSRAIHQPEQGLGRVRAFHNCPENPL